MAKVFFQKDIEIIIPEAALRYAKRIEEREKKQHPFELKRKDDSPFKNLGKYRSNLESVDFILSLLVERRNVSYLAENLSANHMRTHLFLNHLLQTNLIVTTPTKIRNQPSYQITPNAEKFMAVYSKSTDLLRDGKSFDIASVSGLLNTLDHSLVSIIRKGDRAPRFSENKRDSPEIIADYILAIEDTKHKFSQINRIANLPDRIQKIYHQFLLERDLIRKIEEKDGTYYEATQIGKAYLQLYFVMAKMLHLNN